MNPVHIQDIVYMYMFTSVGLYYVMSCAVMRSVLHVCVWFLFNVVVVPTLIGYTCTACTNLFCLTRSMLVSCRYML